MTAIQKQQILNLRVKGEGYGTIATILNISKNTVKSYCQRNSIEHAPQETAAKNNVTTRANTCCKQCGQVIEEHYSKRPRIFCSEKCRYSWWNANRNNPSYQATCAYCSGKFNTRGNKIRKYCSHPCYIAGRFGEVEIVNDNDRRAV